MVLYLVTFMVKVSIYGSSGAIYGSTYTIIVIIV